MLCSWKQHQPKYVKNPKYPVIVQWINECDIHITEYYTVM